MSNPIVDYVSAHQTVIWPIVTGAVLLVARRHTASEWVALGEKHPRLQGLIKFLRGAGLDPQKAVEGLLQILLGTSVQDSRDGQIEELKTQILALKAVNNAQANELLELKASQAASSEGALR